MLSEKQDVQGKKERELKCGKIMWASIAFTIYAALYITLILVQLNIERNYQYNSALKDYIEGKETLADFTLPDIKDYNRLVHWLQEAVPELHDERTQVLSNFTGYYIEEVNYIVGSKMRFCFSISKQSNEKGYHTPYYEKTYSKESE